MEQKKYLTWSNKIGYGSGDLAANCIYAVITNFVLIYLTDAIGLEAGIVGTLILVAKCLDGITDVLFGNLLDKTNTKMGKARPWMLWAHIGNVVCFIALFAIPTSWGRVAQYAYFFITYTLLNAVFFTANNLAYATLTSLITKNMHERVQMGSIRFMFTLVTQVVITSCTVGAVDDLGGGAIGWRNIALIYAVISLIVNTISVFSVKELSAEELAEGMESSSKEEQISFRESLSLLIKNKYFLMMTAFYILMYIQQGITGVGAYWCQYVLGNKETLGTFTAAQMLPMVVGLAIVPFMVKAFGSMYKVNLIGYALATVCRIAFIFAGYALNVPLMLGTMALAGFFAAPATGNANALISEISEYTYRTRGKHISGAMFASSSLGVKVGGGLGTAICGILIDLGGYIPNEVAQPQSAINMLNFMYIIFPLISVALITVLMYFLDVEKANKKWDAEHGRV